MTTGTTAEPQPTTTEPQPTTGSDATTSVDTTSEPGTGSTTGDLPSLPGVTPCALSDDLPQGHWTSGALIRLTPDGGSVYIASNENEIRRYAVGGGSGCTLTLDPQFGAGGVLESFVTSMGPDGSNTLYAAYGNSAWGVRRVWPGAEVTCQPETQIRNVAVDLTGTHRIAVSDDAIFSFAAAGDACDYTPIPGANIPGDWFVEAAAVDASGHMHLGVVADVHPDPGPEYVILRLAPDGQDLGTYSDPSDPFAPEGFCNISDMTLCGDDVCIYDFNCKAIKRYTAAGEFVKETDLGPLGLELDFVPTSIAGDSDGSRVYVTGAYDSSVRGVFRAEL